MSGEGPPSGGPGSDFWSGEAASPDELSHQLQLSSQAFQDALQLALERTRREESLFGVLAVDDTIAQTVAPPLGPPRQLTEAQQLSYRLFDGDRYRDTSWISA